MEKNIFIGIERTNVVGFCQLFVNVGIVEHGTEDTKFHFLLPGKAPEGYTDVSYCSKIIHPINV